MRSSPYGRKLEFNRKTLEVAFPGYRWLGDRLGGFGDISDRAIAELAELARAHRLLVMCMERDPDRCHRKYELAARLRRHGIGAVHL